MKTRLKKSSKQPGAGFASSRRRKLSRQAEFEDNRKTSAEQNLMMRGIDSSPVMTVQRMRLERSITDPVQRAGAEEEEELLQGKFSDPVQRAGEEEEELLQGKFSEPVQREQKSSDAPNQSGMPDNLKRGIESLSGMEMSDLRVHYNSPKPAQLGAHAYAQGNDIHLGAGQEKHLPHEAWHTVQQRQGRVQPTMQMAGEKINDDAGLEQEADVMGAKALQYEK